MVAYARANPGKLNYGSTAVSTRLRIVTILQDRRLDIVHIPYPTTGAAEQALYVGDIHLMITSDAIVSHRDRVTPLAVSGSRRSANFPDIPTYIELGLPPVPGAEYSLNVPAGIPKAAFDRLYAAASRALHQPEVKAQMAKIAFEIVNDTPEAAAKNLADQTKLVADAVKRIGLQPQ
jgi:tripartite-type tricarboxylate transporter receptor subunit TctC